jgi:hypothetical protein
MPAWKLQTKTDPGAMQYKAFAAKVLQMAART